MCEIPCQLSSCQQGCVRDCYHHCISCSGLPFQICGLATVEFLDLSQVGVGEMSYSAAILVVLVRLSSASEFSELFSDHFVERAMVYDR